MKANKTIRWKVVNKNRFSCMGTSNSPFIIYYPKNKCVKAKRNTLGIFCFKTRINAIDFINAQDIDGASILKVKTYGKGKRPSQISPWNDFTAFYKNPNSTVWFSPPKGTICYPAVMPLE